MKAWLVEAAWHPNDPEEGNYSTYVYADDEKDAEDACMEEMAHATQNLAEDYEGHVFSVRRLDQHIAGLKDEIKYAEEFLSQIPL